MITPLIPTSQILLGFGLAVLVSVLGKIARALAVSGAIAAALVGTVIFGFGGMPWAALMLTFFITASLLSKLFSGRKKALTDKFEKGSQRDWAQVLANSGTGGFLAVTALLFPDAVWPWVAYAGAMAAVNADTWATEIGILSPSPPRLITTGKTVVMGTSGGLTLTGTAATFAGGLLIAAIGALFRPDLPAMTFLIAVSVAGLIGSLTDSLLGATVQAIYYDPIRQKETERQMFDAGGNPAAPLRGWVWMNNDMVNFFSSVCGAVAAILLWAAIY
ncbi:MAG: DUF92 domain-containing protein [Anaerolineales bacterium]|nr:DUF92 domain-containing protein [Anaerolineales bacterium]